MQKAATKKNEEKVNLIAKKPQNADNDICC